MRESSPYSKRNTSAVAARKIAAWAKRTGLSPQLTRAIFNLGWDYDSYISWVKDGALPPLPREDLDLICEYTRFDQDQLAEKDEVLRTVTEYLESLCPKQLFADFCVGVKDRNTLLISPFSTYFYLRNATPARLDSLEWSEPINLHRYGRHLFLKLFRSGAMEKYELGYAYVDFRSSCETRASDESLDYSWLTELLKVIEARGSPRLADVLNACKGIVPGDKAFKTLVLEALSYSGILSVADFDYKNAFFADRRNSLSDHFYSNEWQYPLRLWGHGGSVSRAALEALL